MLLMFKLLEKLEPREKEGLIYILGVPLLIFLIIFIAFMTHIVLNP